MTMMSPNALLPSISVLLTIGIVVAVVVGVVAAVAIWLAGRSGRQK